ncbi:hypothetical protein VSDG_01217 [Cytospora chrysosperma]|uniref:Uncharacterized protein n=1 Tax=Cytospora chrysosperma TaxID=252740 RepID=A0A423WIH2_CYTCH|nr:hypothetical protein VSDG_01217 [Valsa sordida]
MSSNVNQPAAVNSSRWLPSDALQGFPQPANQTRGSSHASVLPQAPGSHQRILNFLIPLSGYLKTPYKESASRRAHKGLQPVRRPPTGAQVTPRGRKLGVPPPSGYLKTPYKDSASRRTKKALARPAGYLKTPYKDSASGEPRRL